MIFHSGFKKFRFGNEGACLSVRELATESVNYWIKNETQVTKHLLG